MAEWKLAIVEIGEAHDCVKRVKEASPECTGQGDDEPPSQRHIRPLPQASCNICPDKSRPWDIGVNVEDSIGGVEAFPALARSRMRS